MSPFFGLTPRYKIELHESIFNMVTYGKGGWTWSDVYNMPVHIRSLYMNLLTKALEKENGSKTHTSKVLAPPKVKG